MAFSNLFRRYSNANEIQSASYANMDENSIAETLLDELESQCQNCLSLVSLKKRNSQTYNNTTPETLMSPSSDSSTNPVPMKRHASVDYSWLTPNHNIIQTSSELYHLSDMIKMELSELIRNVLAEDCTSIITQFRRQVRAETKVSTPENMIALFRTTISNYIDEKEKNRSNINNGINSNIKSNAKTSAVVSFVRNNRINPKHQFDDEQHCIAELTEISISSSNDGADNINKLHSKS